MVFLYIITITIFQIILEDIDDVETQLEILSLVGKPKARIYAKLDMVIHVGLKSSTNGVNNK